MSEQTLLKRSVGPHTYFLLHSSYALALLHGIADAAEKLLHLAFLVASIWGAVNFFGKLNASCLPLKMKIANIKVDYSVNSLRAVPSHPYESFAFAY